VTVTLVCLVVIAFYAYFYRVVVARCGRLVRPALAAMRLERDHPLRDVDATGKLAAANIAQLLFALTLLRALSLTPASLVGSFRWDLIALGMVIGVGELGLASNLCAALNRLTMPATTRSVTVRPSFAQGRGGWMALFGATARTLPPWLAALVIGTYVLVEELVFRGILIGLLRPAGGVMTVATSSALFVAVQVFNMPSLRTAIVPAVGAAVIGLVHGVLYWRTAQLLPLMAAHVTFFATALWTIGIDDGLELASAHAR
jgi:membrane protease YdiL (CAAX protease family)